jgi:hypothetical protein
LSEYFPDVYTNLRHAYPEVAQALDALGAATGAAGPLEERAQQLVKLGIAIGGLAEGAVRSNTRRALNWESRPTRSAMSLSWPLPPPPFLPQSPGSPGSRRYWRPGPERPQLLTGAARQRLRNAEAPRENVTGGERRL